ncbi:MAG TPA: DegT/DnrJ/EryC1/StrS aminotransferase family protein [bacterium]|nr:DegT/DnrJ/EryC1/StrS aminotransferase family protein [bacterium]
MPLFDRDDLAAVTDALTSTFVSGDGPACRAFERDLSGYLGVKHVFFTTSCTAALDLAFMIKGFPADSEVLVPDFTFTSSALGPILNGLRVVLVDVRADNGNVNVGKIEAKITPRTVAIVPVDYAGNPVEMDEVNHLARRHGLYVVHDAAQSIGAEYRGRRIGSVADVSCFSFHGTKNLAVGEGGAIATDHDDLAARILIAREKGTDKHRFLSNPQMKGYYAYVARGNSYVQSNILGALGRSQLKKLDSMNSRRWAIAEYYREHLRDIEGIRFPTLTQDAKTNWHLFCILVNPRVKDWVIDALRAEGVTANIHYHPLHLNPYYREVCHFRDDEFQDSVKFFESLVRLPMYAGMSDQDAADVVAAVRKVIPHSERVALRL